MTAPADWAPAPTRGDRNLLGALLERAQTYPEDAAALSPEDLQDIVAMWVEDRLHEPERERLLQRIREVDRMIADYIIKGRL